MRAQRLALGISAEELVAKMGEHGVRITVQQIEALEHGERRAVDYEVLAIAKALKVTANWLVTGRDC